MSKTNTDTITITKDQFLTLRHLANKWHQLIGNYDTLEAYNAFYQRIEVKEDEPDIAKMDKEMDIVMDNLTDLLKELPQI